MGATLHWLFLGAAAEITAGLLGLIGSLVLTAPAWFSLGTRKLDLQLGALIPKSQRSDDLEKLRDANLKTMRRQLELERRLIVAGCLMLAASFLVLMLHAIVEGGATPAAGH